MLPQGTDPLKNRKANRPAIIGTPEKWRFAGGVYTLVNVYVDLVVFTRIAGTS